MKLKNLFFASLIGLALGATLLLGSCGGDDDSEPPLTFESDPEAFCAANALDGKCCVPEYNLDCHCTTGDNAETDTENCCLKEYNLECFCTENPDDEACEQNFGEGNGLGLMLDFENDENTENLSVDIYNPSGKMTFEEDANIPAVEGAGYISATWDVDEEGRGWHDFKYDPNGESTDAAIDFSSMTNPVLNMWVNSGPNETDSLAFTIAFWGKELEDGSIDQVDHPIDPLFKASTSGEWKLYSFPLNELTGLYNWGGDPIPVDLSAKYSLLKIVFRPSSVSGKYVAHLDAVSITDGPLEQLPWIK